MEIGITWKYKKVYDKEVDIEKVIAKGLEVAGLVALGTIALSNANSMITTAFADQLPEVIRPTITNQIMDEILELVENPMSTYTNFNNHLNSLMDTFNQFVHSVGPF